MATREAFEALEERLSTATNTIELTVGEVRKIAHALRDLDQRTSGIEKLPDGRTKFGDFVAGSPKLLWEIGDKALETYHQGDYSKAFPMFSETVRIIESLPTNSYSFRDWLPPRSKAYYYRMAANSAMRLSSNSIAHALALRALEIHRDGNNRATLCSAKANLAADDLTSGHPASALAHVSEAIEMYEGPPKPQVSDGVSVYSGIVAYRVFTNSVGEVDSKLYDASKEEPLKGEFFSPAQGVRLYCIASYAALQLTNASLALNYYRKAADEDASNPLVAKMAELLGQSPAAR